MGQAPRVSLLPSITRLSQSTGLPSALNCFLPKAVLRDCNIAPVLYCLLPGPTGSLTWSLLPVICFLSLLHGAGSGPSLPFFPSPYSSPLPTPLILPLSPRKGTRRKGACHPSWKLALAWQTAFLRRKMATFKFCSAGHLSNQGQ